MPGAERVPVHIMRVGLTGFGHDEEAFLVRNAVCFHHFESRHKFFGDLWLESIWEVFVLYWPPAERSDDALAGHHERVCQALRWIYEHLDPGAHEAEQANIQFPQVHHPGPKEQRRMTIRPLQPGQPLDVVLSPEFLTKSHAIHAAKIAVKACLRCLRLLEECQGYALFNKLAKLCQKLQHLVILQGSLTRGIKAKPNLFKEFSKICPSLSSSLYLSSSSGKTLNHTLKSTVQNWQTSWFTTACLNVGKTDNMYQTWAPLKMTDIGGESLMGAGLEYRLDGLSL
ncbi:hypothetical protein EDD18DRAFT_1107857 [Armillaria luteobubalina]|uniref:Uncharacterized protein n=1 Tax=Armillaria luteobubalina TaxID=153913 RepID=A0AA39Q0B4_9AGAR|nr:hypothetical protein EDD18DRAFT_1107857 [Armillaria luteobubalina]